MPASPEMKRFFEFLARNTAVQDQFRQIESQDDAIAKAVEVANDNGFDLDDGEMREWLDSETAEGKLSDEQLEQVAGGSACWTKTGYHTCPCESGYCASGC